MTTLADLCEPWPPGEAPPLDRLDEAGPRSVFQEQWQRDGFVIIRPDTIGHAIDAYADAWREANIDRPGGWPYATPYMECPALLDLASDGAVHAMMRHLVGEPMGLHLALTGWTSTQRNWHQDGYLNPDTAADWYCAAWFALDDIHPDAGPFELVAGSHREFGVIRQDRMLAALDPSERGPDWPRLSERILTPLFEQAIVDRGLTTWQFHARRGDVLLWHPRLLHRGSVPNDPERERRAVILHYSGVTHRPDMPRPCRHRGGWFFPIAGRQPVSQP